MAARPIILDTDVGTDVDDAFAIALAARSPELKLEAVTTVFGHVTRRARMARKLLDLLDQSAVPVARGMESPITPGKEVYWGGWEGEGFLSTGDESLPLDPRNGVDLICDLLETAAEPITLVAIGPLTNIATVILLRPDLLPAIDEIICMAGTIVPGQEEWNVQCDPEAARIVFQSGLPITLGTRFIVNQPRLTQLHRQRLAARCDDPAVHALVAMLDVFLDRKQRDSTPMYDPVTLSMAFTEKFVQTQAMAVAVQLEDGVLHLTPQPSGEPNMHISVGVQPELFVDALVDRLLGQHEQ
ncbi:MAG: nucleoside hydrolase [Chloroflexota bacterium]|nr:nucleoside hydrolase [Chloroflexota bacterium]